MMFKEAERSLKHEKMSVYPNRAVGSSARRRGSLGYIPAGPPSMEPWPSELPSSYDAASQLKDEKRQDNDILA